MPELAVVIPTFNERNNIVPLLQLLSNALEGISYEVIFVDDDSSDGTAEAVRQISLYNPGVRIVHRINRRGLASACLEGMLASSAPFIAVLDADLQHDERILPEMLREMKRGNLDIVVGSRNVEGGSMGEFTKRRVWLSTLGRRFSRAVSRSEISDPMSGFFLLDRRFLMEVVHRLSAIGFKILLDLLTSSERPVRVKEIPYRFRQRIHGESKLDTLVAVEYLQLLFDKAIGDFIPPTFALFVLVGCIGAAVHVLLLWLQLFSFHMSFGSAQIIATLFAMTANFLLNNVITYRDRRLHGWLLLRGLIIFYIACSIGVLINIKSADITRGAGLPWYIAGLFGLAVGSVWNYGVTRIFTWRSYKQSARKQRLEQASARSTST